MRGDEGVVFLILGADSGGYEVGVEIRGEDVVRVGEFGF